MRARRCLGVGVVGFGWMGQAHSRSLMRNPSLFPDRSYDVRLVICGDPIAERRERAISDFGFSHIASDWREVVAHPTVDVVVCAGPNMLHVEVVEAAAAAGKHVFCEKPVGGRPEDVARAAAAIERAGVIGGVGYCFRWAPLVLHAKTLIDDGRLGAVTNYRGRFLSMYGSDPLGLLSWRFLTAEGGHGVTSDLLCHAVDLAHMLLGPITRVVGAMETFIPERPLSQAGGVGHYGRGAPGDPRGQVTNEDYAGMLCEFACGARGTFEASRTMIGPESQMAFDVHGIEGALGWSLERLNELRVNIPGGELERGYTTVFGGDRFAHHGAFAPGDANGIGFEDLIAIEDHEFCAAVVEDRPFAPGFEEALDYAAVQTALIRSAHTGAWEDVVPLRQGVSAP